MLHLLPFPDKPALEDKPIIRSLAQGPDYKPDWRLRVTEQYLLRSAGAKDTSSVTDVILATEGDPFVRQLLCFHSGRRTVIACAIEYALRCNRYAHTTRIPALIKGMVVCGRSGEQIANEVATTAINVRTFEKLNFDVRRFANNRTWLRDICFPMCSTEIALQHQFEHRVLAIAYEGGWPRLENLLLSQQSERSTNTKADLDQLTAILTARALDYVIGLEARGIRPSERDLELLFLAQRRMPMAALPPFSPSERTANPAALRKKIEAEKKAKELSPLARERIRRLLEVAKSDRPLEMDKKLGIQQPFADSSGQ